MYSLYPITRDSSNTKTRFRCIEYNIIIKINQIHYHVGYVVYLWWNMKMLYSENFINDEQITIIPIVVNLPICTVKRQDKYYSNHEDEHNCHFIII